MSTNENTIDFSGHAKAELYKSTIREVKAHFLVVGHGEGQAIKKELLDKYLDLYPSKLEGVFLYGDGVVVQTDTKKFKIGNHLTISELSSDNQNDEFYTLANQFLHQLSLMYPLYCSRSWVREAERVVGALESLNDSRFI